MAVGQDNFSSFSFSDVYILQVVSGELVVLRFKVVFWADFAFLDIDPPSPHPPPPIHQ